MRTSKDIWDLLEEAKRAAHVPPTAAELDHRRLQEERSAEVLRQRAKRHERDFGVLPPDTLVKPQISWLRDHWLLVVNDPGPENNEERSVFIKRREPDRDEEVYRVRRDRMKVYVVHSDDKPITDTAGTLAGTPMPGDFTGRTDAGTRAMIEKVATSD